MSDAPSPAVDLARTARALRQYTRWTAGSFFLLYGAAFGFALFTAWWDTQGYPTYRPTLTQLLIRVTPVLFLVPRVIAGVRGFGHHRLLLLVHLAWAGAFALSLLAIVAPAWAPFALLAMIAWGLGCVRDVAALRLLAHLTGDRALLVLAVAWALHESAWALLGRAVFVTPSLTTAVPALTTFVLGVITLRRLRHAHTTLMRAASSASGQGAAE